MGTEEVLPLRVVLVLPGHNAGVKWRRKGCRVSGQREYLAKGFDSRLETQPWMPLLYQHEGASKLGTSASLLL
ncbi:hypothetical protein GJAV_G00003930 [Gymnothorax javanicus]|nr:hypothetical protein GJAV_G00003930 [Gymnothorax javanicus]